MSEEAFVRIGPGISGRMKRKCDKFISRSMYDKRKSLFVFVGSKKERNLFLRILISVFILAIMLT